MASPQVAQAKTAGGALEQIDAFLSQVTSEYQKSAADESQKDKPSNTPAAQAEPKAGEVSTSQRSLGKEQTDAAQASGSTVNVVAANTNADNKQPGDGKADQPQQTGADEKTTQVTPRHQETTQEKVARTIRLGNALLSKLAESEAKKEGESEKQEKAEKKDEKKDEKKAPAAKPGTVAAAVAPLVPPAMPKVAADAFFDKCANVAAEKATEYFNGFLAGMLKRAQDEAELANVDWAKLGVTKEALDAVGGPSGLLDKVAAEDPAAVLPEGLAGMVPEAGAAPEGMPPEGMAPEGVAPGGGTDEVADALAEAGVQPEDIDQAAQALNELFQSGVSPEEAAQAVQEIVSEQQGAGAAPEGAAPEMPAEAPPAEKAAADMQRMNVIKQHLRGNLK
jgi:hypothetical protein